MSLNFILHGECNVGKTSLRNRWVDGVFTGDVAPTFGVDFNIKTLDLVQELDEEENEDDEARGSNAAASGEVRPAGTGHSARGNSTMPASCADQKVKINVYDTSGKPGYRDVNSTYLLAFDAVLFVYDISSMASLNELRRYFNDPEHRDKLAAKRRTGMAMLLVGNKSDVPLSQRQVGSQTGHDAAAEFGIPFVEVSAKTGANVREAFMLVTTRAVAEHLTRDRLSHPTGRPETKSLQRTMQTVPALQRALRVRANVLDVFSGRARRRKHGPKQAADETLVQQAKDGGGKGTKTKSQRPTERAGSDRPGGGATLDSQKQHLLRFDPPSPRATATAASYPAARGGTGHHPTSSLLERPEEASPTTGRTRQKSPRHEMRGRTSRSRSGSPRHAVSGPRSSLGSARSKSPASSSKSPRSPAAVSPRHALLDPEIVVGDGSSPSARSAATAKGRGQVTRAGGSGGRSSSSTVGSAPSPTALSAAEQEFLLHRRPGRASPERTVGGGVEESATRQLKEASSYWLAVPP
eukprot:g2236.t1